MRPTSEKELRTPIQVAVTGAAGNIGYALLWRIASGDCFGANQPVILQLLEIPPGMQRLEGVIMELRDSAFPLVHDIIGTDDPKIAFNEAEAIFLVGSRPRTKDMDRADLVAANGPIFVGQGKAIDAVSSRNVKVITVGNPCNTNALIASANAPGISSRQFTAMTRLDQNRAVGLIAQHAGVPASKVHDVFIWGNHANTMYPDPRFGTVDGRSVTEMFDSDWLEGSFLDTVATRGKAIIMARGASSAASAASAAVDHMHDWWLGSNGRIVSMALPSEGWYGVPEGLVFSFPCRCEGGEVIVVDDLTVNAFAQAKIDENVAALLGERDAVSDLL
ncbi:MAG: malate dehydrogenase [Candidatus Thalassarchaeaceae archaeon]|jgi:malate dehydrogenase|nr:malate dehydrogenase [Candidatus Thalassarchaeaceae archaeon]MDP6317881.1 malate dehydrogenase [Candidatus Thalassarchaeaceae archaeon]HJM29610.1 malate dehydrogenase [Candidatus Thalassarchaeaceae archaeon]